MQSARESSVPHPGHQVVKCESSSTLSGRLKVGAHSEGELVTEGVLVGGAQTGLMARSPGIIDVGELYPFSPIAKPIGLPSRPPPGLLWPYPRPAGPKNRSNNPSTPAPCS